MSDVDAIVLCEIRDTPLSPTEVLAAVDHPAAGGTALFVGTVRDHDGGRDVKDLQYSSHPSAVDRMREVVEAIVAEHDVHRIAVVHRVGDLAIGDLAIVAAASTGHRGEAFAACKDLVDRVKATVPIWKHQAFTDGSTEWVGTP